MSDGRVFNVVHIVKIPLYIWILLKLKKSHIGTDTFELGENKHTYVTYAKKIFGEIYIMKTEHYVNEILRDYVKLKRIESYPKIHGMSVRYMSMDELI